MHGLSSLFLYDYYNTLYQSLLISSSCQISVNIHVKPALNTSLDKLVLVSMLVSLVKVLEKG